MDKEYVLRGRYVIRFRLISIDFAHPTRLKSRCSAILYHHQQRQRSEQRYVCWNEKKKKGEKMKHSSTTVARLYISFQYYYRHHRQLNKRSSEVAFVQNSWWGGLSKSLRSISLAIYYPQCRITSYESREQGEVYRRVGNSLVDKVNDSLIFNMKIKRQVPRCEDGMDSVVIADEATFDFSSLLRPDPSLDWNRMLKRRAASGAYARL